MHCAASGRAKPRAPSGGRHHCLRFQVVKPGADKYFGFFLRGKSRPVLLCGPKGLRIRVGEVRARSNDAMSGTKVGPRAIE